MSSRTIDIAALTYQTLANRLSNIKISQAALTDTLTPQNLPAVLYKVATPASVPNAPRVGVGTTAQIVITALATSRVQARDVCDKAVSVLMDAVGDEDTEHGWFSRVALTQEPVAVTAAPTAGARIFQYSAAADVIARRNTNQE